MISLCKHICCRCRSLRSVHVWLDSSKKPSLSSNANTSPSFFFGTQLASVLINERIDTVIITGTTTSGCVRATTDDAAALNFRVIIPQEAVADRYSLSHQVTLFDIDSWLGDVMPLEAVIAHLETVKQGSAA